MILLPGQGCGALGEEVIDIEQWWNDKQQRKTEETGVNHTPVHLRPSQI